MIYSISININILTVRKLRWRILHMYTGYPRILISVLIIFRFPILDFRFNIMRNMNIIPSYRLLEYIKKIYILYEVSRL